MLECPNCHHKFSRTACKICGIYVPSNERYDIVETEFGFRKKIKAHICIKCYEKIIEGKK
jgi:hypothetical protein